MLTLDKNLLYKLGSAFLVAGVYTVLWLPNVFPLMFNIIIWGVVLAALYLLYSNLAFILMKGWVPS